MHRKCNRGGDLLKSCGLGSFDGKTLSCSGGSTPRLRHIKSQKRWCEGSGVMKELP
jgi:hypothetical protein